MASLTRVAASLVQWLGKRAGSKATQLQDYLDESVPSITSFGAKGDGTTDDTAALNLAIASLGTAGGRLYIPKNVGGTDRYFMIPNWSLVVNPYGVEFIGEGSLMSNATQGGLDQRNTYANTGFRVSMGQEYLYRAYQRLVIGGRMNIITAGDSTVESGQPTDNRFWVTSLLSHIFEAQGMRVNVTNRGVSGTSWYQMDIVGQLTSTTDLLIIKYGINDNQSTIVNDARTKLAEIRASQYGGKRNLSIILMGPNSTSDWSHDRANKKYERQHGMWKQLAIDFECAYFDTYGYMPDTRSGAGNILDDPFGNGQGVHPMDTMNNWVWGQMVEEFFSQEKISWFRSNNFFNISSDAGSPAAATGLVNYNQGLSIYRITDWAGTGAPDINGAAVTTRSADDVGYQTAVSFDQLSSVRRSRTWNTATSSWNYWTGKAYPLTTANGWQATISPNLKLSDNGMVTINAFLTAGTVTDGTTVLAAPPVGLRPPVEMRFVQLNNDGTTFGIGINSGGNIFLVGSGAKASGIHVNFSYYI